MIPLPDGEDQITEGTGLIAKVKSFATLITAIGALVTALGSWMKPPDTTATQKSYSALTQELKELSEENQKQHDMIMGLRGALDQMVRTQTYSYNQPPVVHYNPQPQPTPPVVLTPPEQLFGGTQTVTIPKPKPKLPEAAPRPKEYKPETFDEILKK